MKNILLISFMLLTFVSNAYAQESIFTKSVEWKDLEKKYELKYRISEINKIKDDLLNYFNENEDLDQNLSDFHFLDYDFNGIIDIIYSGYGGIDSMRTLIFELGKDGYYHSTFNKIGELINIVKYSVYTPVSLVLRDVECCGGNQIVYEVYHLSREKSQSKYVLSAKYSSFRQTDIPKDIFDKPILFKVVNEKYYLRLNPFLNKSQEYNEDLHIDGNIVQSYTYGSNGYAIAKKIDLTGRVWWFVIMLNNLNKKGAISEGSNNDVHNYSIGWMSSRYLKKLN